MWNAIVCIVVVCITLLYPNAQLLYAHRFFQRKCQVARQLSALDRFAPELPTMAHRELLTGRFIRPKAMEMA